MTDCVHEWEVNLAFSIIRCKKCKQDMTRKEAYLYGKSELKAEVLEMIDEHLKEFMLHTYEFDDCSWKKRLIKELKQKVEGL